MINCPICDCELKNYESGSKIRIVYPGTNEDTGICVSNKKVLVCPECGWILANMA